MKNNSTHYTAKINSTLGTGKFFNKTSVIDLNHSGGFRRLLILSSMILFGLVSKVNIQAQVSNYSFAASAGAYTPLAGPTNVFTGAWDDNAAVSVPLGFTFTFNGIGYTTVFVHPNGYLTFGTSTSGYLPISGGSAAAGIISGWGRDLQSQNTVPLGSVDYLSSGGVFTVQWSNTRRYNGATLNAERFEMQIQLVQATGVIQLVYGTWSDAVSAITANNGEVGLRGASGADFKNLSVLSGGNWAAPAAGAVNTATCFYNETSVATKPAPGQTYTFTPPVPCVTPPSQPTSLILNPSAGSIAGSFTAAGGSPSGYLVLRTATNVPPAAPVDGTTYTPGTNALGGFVVSTSTTTSFNATGLIPSTPYYFWIYSYNNLCIGAPFYQPSAPLAGNTTTSACSISGTRSVGPTGFYLTLTAAFADLLNNGVSGPTILELQSTYLSSAEPAFPVVVPVIPCISAINNVVVRPQAGATALSITSANATGTLNFDGGDFVTFDGRAGGVGVSQLTISNTVTTGYAIQLINSATFNTIRYCTVAGVNTGTTSGVIFFSTAVGFATGNSNNTIDNCDLRDGATTPLNLIFGSGSITNYAIQNNNNTVSNNTIHDWFSATSTTPGAGINIVAGASDWTITGNSFYQTVTRTFTITTATDQGAIFINSALFGTNFTISNNFIGGTAPLCGGTPWTYTGVATGTPTPRLIRFAAALGAVSNISGNTIANLSLTTATTNNGSSLIAHVSGNINITNNTLGSQSTTGNVVFTLTNATVGVFFLPIGFGTGAVPCTINVSNNNLGGITVATTSTGSGSFRIIYGQPPVGSSITVNNNIIGGTVANSIQQLTNNIFVGVLILNPSIGGVYTNNTIRNLTLTNAGVTGTIRGVDIQASGGGHTITGNTVFNLTTNAANVAINNAASIVGITMTGSVVGGSNISNNTIFNLTNTNATLAGWINGMYFGTGLIPQPNTIISKNFVHSINLSSPLAGMAGILLPNLGNAQVFNNMIRLGIDANGADITNALQINGIYKTSTGYMNINHNTIYIGGSGVASGAVNTYGIRRTANPLLGVDTIMNNIVYNARSNASGTGKHYAVNMNSSALLLENYNDLLTNGIGGVLGLLVAADFATLPAWQAGTNQDWNSVSSDPFLINPTGNSATLDLHIQPASATPVEQGGYNIPFITLDFDLQTRSTLTPVDIGADAGIFTLLDLTAPAIYYTPLLNSSCNTGDRTISGVNITDVTGIPLAGGLRPRIYYRKNAGAYFSQPGTFVSGPATNSFWNFTIVAADMGGLVAADVVSYYIIAQDIVATPNIGSNPAGVIATDVNTVTTHPVTPYTFTVLGTSLSGTYTVGVGGNYTTLTAAVAAYNTACLNGPVLFSLTDASYAGETFPITINANPFASAVNTLTIKPAAGATPAISGTSATALIVLNGADWVTIDGSNGNTANTICPPSVASRDLTLTNTSTSTTSAVIWLQTVAVGLNAAANNTIKNTNLLGNLNTQTFVGVGSGSATISTASLGTLNNNNAYINNNISRTQYGIFSQGSSLGAKNTGTVINQNLVNTVAPNNTARGGIVVGFENNITISGNNISEIALTSSPDVFGIAMGGISITATAFAGNEVTNATVSQNIIGSVRNSGTFSACGIFVAPALSGTNLIANNMISGVSANGTAGDFSIGMLLGGGLGSTTNVYYNTITLTSVNPLTGGSSPSFALGVGGVNPVVDIRNNILVNTQNNGTGNNYAIGYGYSPFSNLTSDHNDYVVGVGATFFTGGTGSLGAPTNQLTLANLQAVTGKDGAGQTVAPVFVSATDLHLSAAAGANACLDGEGIPIPGVTIDIDCQTRNAVTPDIGADEFTGPVSTITVTETSGLVNNDGIICAGASATITATGGGTYLWSTGETTASIVVSPAMTTVYTVSITNGTCVEILSTTITVTPAPTAGITVTETSGVANNDGTICAGTSATLTGTGGVSYLWSTGETTTSIVVTPGGTTGYTVTVTNANLCTATATTTITVTPLPTAGITGNTSACIGATVNLTATGGTSYLWGTGETTPSISFPMPGAPSIICVTVTDNGCSSATCVALTPLLGPIVTITGPDSICAGSGATLSVPAGFPAYLWSTGETTNSITVFPAVLTVYTVTVTGANGCTSVASHTVDVNAVPTYTFIITDVSNCNTADGAITITMTGGDAPFTFNWTTPNGCGVNPGAQNQSGICAGSYFMTVTDNNGCSNTGIFFVDGPSPGCFSCPTISTLTAVPTPVCPDVPILFTASGLAGMGVTYGIEFKLFNAPTGTPYVGGIPFATVPNGSLGNGGTTAQASTSFATPGTYYIYAVLSPVPTDPGCVPFATTTIVINAIPTGPTSIAETSGVEVNDGIICIGDTAVLTAAGGSTSYVWSTGDTTQIITVAPTATTTYTVTLTNGLGCSNAISTTITVDSLPIASIAPPSAAICAGSPVTLTASGGGTYLWSTGATTAAITVSPAGTTTYTVTVTNANACSATASATVNVVPVPVVNPVANQIYCVGASVPSVVFSSSTPGAVFNWSRTAEAIGLAPVNGTGNVPAFTATNAGTTPLTSTFTVTPSVTSGGITCTGTPITFTITINPTPQVNAVVSQTYCAGSVVPAIVFAGNVPGATYSWTRTSEAIGAIPTAGTSSVPSFTATNAGVAPLTSTFTVTASFANNGVTCTGTPITFTITVNPVPTVNAVASQTYCAGASVPAINFTSNVPGVVFNWTRTNVPIGAIPTMGVGGVPTFIATNAGTTPISSVFTVTASYTNSGVTCTSAPITFTITVNPTPVVTPVSNQTYCAGANVPPIFFNSNVPGAVLTWTRTGDDIGLGPVSGTGSIPPFTGINNTAGPLVATITVVATYTNNGVTCTSAPITFTITICYNLGSQRILGDAYVCPGQVVTYSVENPNPNSTYNWIIQNGGGEIINDNGTSITIEWQDIPGGPFMIQLDASGCGNACHAFAYLPVYIQGVDAVTCNDNVQISLNENCIAEVLSGMILEGEVEGNNNYYVVLTDAFGNNIPGAILTSDHIGQTVTAMVLNECNGQSCWGTISVEDKIPPAMECNDVTLSCGSSLEPVFEPPVTGNALASVNPGAAIGPNQGQVTLTDLVLDLPSNAVITDVNVTVDLEHTWSGDLDVVLISPEGTEVVLASAVCGSADNWDNVTFDDQAGIPVNIACNNNPPPALLAGSVIPQELLVVLNGQSPLGTWTLRITDLANADAGTLNLFALNVAYYLAAPNAPVASDACGELNLTYTDSYEGEDCEDVILTRTWTATDGSGNAATCTQIITIIPLTLDNITFPEAYVGQCGETVFPINTGWPTVDGQPITDQNNICNIFVGYWDKELNECGGGRKIVRTWTILDWCTVEVVEAVQVIKLQDTEGPELTCPQDYEVGTDFWYCYANVSVPKPGATDECSEIASYSLTSTSGTVVSFGNNYVINGLELGTHTVTWTVADECGNETTCSFEITVVDDVVPVANCDAHTIVALTNDGPKGITLVPATVFDDGSYDNCGPVTFRARRMDSCIDFDWTTEGACIDDTPGGIPPVNSRDRGTVHRPCVPFSCCDVGAGPIMVELEVTDAAGNVNFCMVEATVQDKIAPFVECPADIVVSCDFWFNVQEGTFGDSPLDHAGNGNGNLDEDPLSAVFGNMYDAFRYDESIRQNIIINDPSNDDYHPQPYNWGLDGWADDNCEVNLQVRVRVVDDCSGGDLPGNAPDGAVKMIERRFSASDGNDGVAPGTCTQRIWVVDFDPFYITDNTCNNSNPQDGVIWPCDVLLTTCPEDLGNLGQPTLFDDACSLIGVTYEDTRFDFVDGACYKILREWAVIDWCQYNSQTGEGLWHYTQVIKVHDEDGPEFVDPCETVTLCVADDGVSLPANNQAFLGEDNPLSSSCSAHLNLRRTVHETCSDIVKFDVKIYPFNGTDYILVAPTSTAVVDSNNNAILGFDTRQSTIQAIRLNGIPYNSQWCGDYHRILWSVEDGCGNWSHCEYLFRLEDCKQPSPVCINGLSTVVMPIGGEVTVWAKDFNASSFDDCTPEAELLYSFDGDTYTPSYTYTCENVPAFNVEIATQIWVADGGTDDNCNSKIEWTERNRDFCSTTIVITDNAGVCDTSGPIAGSILAGEILTEHTAAIANVNVTLTSPGHFFPQYITSQDGHFEFNNVPMGDDYSIATERNDEHKNGVSTLDLVRIQKHLLGKELFTTPYQYIAADANSSQSVSAIDLIEIRKLILGIYTEFPLNTSWRFVQEGYQMNPENPWPFNEIIQIPDLASDSMMHNDFVGVKVGDVNNTAKANANQILPRNGRRVLHVALEGVSRVEAGDVVDIKLSMPESVDGFQWTLETEGLTFDGVRSETMNINDSHIGLLKDGVITMSWNVEGEQTVLPGQVVLMRFIATASGNLEDMIHLTSRVTEAEAYTPEGEILDVKLGHTETGAEFALYQNEPNPYKGNTVIGYDLPDACNVTLTIFDITGKVVYLRDHESVKGYNTIVVNSKELPSVGVMYYRLDAREYTATKKMIIIE